MAGDLLDGLRRGDAAAYREAVRVHGPALYSFLLRLAGRKEVADDLFQETWLALARHATRLRADTRLEAWLFTVARNAHRSHRRWRWADLSRWLVDEDVEAVATTPSPEDAAARSQEARAVEIEADERLVDQQLPSCSEWRRRRTGSVCIGPAPP